MMENSKQFVFNKMTKENKNHVKSSDDINGLSLSELAAYQINIDEVKEKFHTDLLLGLSSEDAAERLILYGKNQLEGGPKVTAWKVLLKQCTNAMILVLILALALSFGIKDYIEGGVVTAVVILNVTIGFFQEYRAEKTMDSLRSLSSPTACVIRNGIEKFIPAIYVVPGDIVKVKTGDVLPADIRIFDAMNFETDEALLTGESIPILKDQNVVYSYQRKPIPVGDRLNMAYASSTVTKGRTLGVVIATGMKTEIGMIAASLGGTKKKKKPSRSLSRHKFGFFQPVKGITLQVYDYICAFLGLTVGTPLQRKLAKLAYILLFCACILAIIVFSVNKFNVSNEVTIYAISLGIAIIPESLIAVLTITMAVGMKRMVKKKVIVRKLDALEALGGVTNICSDKTGTLTQGKMVVRKVWIPSVGIYTVTKTSLPNNPLSGNVSLIPFDFSNIKTNKESPEEIYNAKEENLDNARSALALKFDEATCMKSKNSETCINYRELKNIKEKYSFISPTLKEKNSGYENCDSESLDKDRKESHTNIELNNPLINFLEASSLCNIANVRYDTTNNIWKASGDPTEIALQVFASRFKGYDKTSLIEKGWVQLAEFPFDSDVKRMSVIFRAPDTKSNIHVFIKGAVERILNLCDSIILTLDSKPIPITSQIRSEIEKMLLTFADEGLRVLAVAQKLDKSFHESYVNLSREQIEFGFTLIGLTGLYDPPRLETKGAVQMCTTAGIRVHMLTGDHPGTASAIAREVGIIPRNKGRLEPEIAKAITMTASEFDSLTDQEVDALPVLPLVVARCAPNTKVRMIEALHRRKAYAAMTGDGVNDSPSLKIADVGIAMGMGGSDVAKAASDIVLTDDNFASIVSAIEEGRRMFDNIQKFVLHLLVSNVAEVILLVVGLAFKDSKNLSVFPLAPLQILWINIITSSVPAFGLSLEPASLDIMHRKPHNTKTGVFTIQIICDMAVYGITMGALCLLTFVIVVYGANNGDLGINCNAATTSDVCKVVYRARSSVFAEITWLILISAWEFKSLRRSMFRLNPLEDHSSFPFFRDIYSNKLLFYAVVVGALSVFPAVYIPFINTTIFRMRGISWEWALSVGAVVIFILVVEIWKYIKRYYGLFNEGVRDTVPRELSLRQGFFSFTKSVDRNTYLR